MVPGMINGYGKVYFKEFKYLSDSRRWWREPVEEIIESGQYKMKKMSRRWKKRSVGL